MSDITERKLAEAKLHETNRRLETATAQAESRQKYVPGQYES
jgi:hypothetical protein